MSNKHILSNNRDAFKRPKNFNEFWDRHQDDELKFIVTRDNWLAENKAKQILDKIPSDELPQCDQLDPDNSKVGDFISRKNFEKIYDEKNELYDAIKKGVLCYSFNDVQTWWMLKEGKDGDGLVRIK